MKKRQNVPYICKESPRKKHLKASGRQESKTYSCIFRDKKGEKKSLGGIQLMKYS